MKKRILAIVLSMALSAACLTACGEDNKQEKDKAETTTTTEATTTTTTTEAATTTTTSKTTTTTTTTKKNTTEQYVKPLKPEEKPNENGYWHTESTTKATTKATTTTTKATTKKTTTAANKKITAADLKAAAEAELVKIQSVAQKYGWTSETKVVRSTNTQYGIYMKYSIPIDSYGDSDNFICSILKAEVRNGSISVFDAQRGLDNSSEYDYDAARWGGPVSDVISALQEYGIPQ